jgi:hypothetical protein
MADVSLTSTAHGLTRSLGLTRLPDVVSQGVDEDPFHDPLARWIGIGFVLMIAATLVLTGLLHWGVEYRSPSWSSHAYPPAIVH